MCRSGRASSSCGTPRGPEHGGVRCGAKSLEGCAPDKGRLKPDASKWRGCAKTEQVFETQMAAFLLRVFRDHVPVANEEARLRLRFPDSLRHHH